MTERSAPTLQLFVSGGHREGLGHVLRGAALAQDARSLGVSVGFALEGDAAAGQVAQAEMPFLEITPWSEAMSRAKTSPPRWMAFDTRRAIAQELRRARAAGARCLVLDRLDHREDADLTIIPALQTETLGGGRIKQGPQFAVIAPALRRLHVPPYPGDRHVLLVSLGGADPRHCTERVVDALIDRRDGIPPHWDVHVALGAAFDERAALLENARRAGFETHRALPRADFSRLIQASQLALLGFGTAIYEAAYLGVPVVYVTHHRGDVAAAERLSALGLGRFGACGTRFDGDRFARVLGRVLADEAWRGRASRRGRALLGDGGGSRRILDALGLCPALQPASEVLHGAGEVSP